MNILEIVLKIIKLSCISSGKCMEGSFQIRNSEINANPFFDFDSLNLFPTALFLVGNRPDADDLRSIY